MTEHVLLARLDSAGDVLLAGPAVRAVAASAGRVTLLCGPRGVRAAELLPGVDEIVVFEAPWIDPEPRPVDREATVDLVLRLARLGIDRAFLLTSFHQSPLPLALLLRLAGVPCLAAASEDYPGSLLDLRHRADERAHEVERALSLVRAWGYDLPPGDDGRLGIRPVPAWRWTRPYVVVHPGASVPARTWPPERFAALVDALLDAGRAVVVTGGPGEVETAAGVAGPPCADVLDLAGSTSLRRLASVLAGADAVVTGNTGPAHLAAAVGTPVVSIFPPTVPAARWRPWGVPHRLLGWQEIECAGCRARVCPVPGQPCISSIAVADVVRAVDEVARRPQEAEPSSLAAPRESDRVG